MFVIPRLFPGHDGTYPHALDYRVQHTQARGLNAHGLAVVESVGIKDIRTKALRSNNPCNVVRATLAGLSELRTAEEVAAVRGKSVSEIL